MLTEEKKAKIKARSKAKLAEKEVEEGLIGDTIRGAAKGFLGEETQEEGLIGDTIRGAAKGFLGEEAEEVEEGLIGDTIRGAARGFLGMNEAIDTESDLILKLKPIAEPEIYDFMDNLKGGTYFNMGMYSSIAIAKAYKSTYRLYKVVEMSAIVSGVDYENIGTTKEFRDETGKQAGSSWYHHEPGREHKVALKNSDPNEKYVLWDIKANSGSTVKYYLIDIATGAVTPVSKDDVMSSVYLTATEKAKLAPKAVTGYNLTTGELVENKTNWRTTKFEHIFWLSQAGKAAREYGVRFAEEFCLNEEFTADMFIDEHANVDTDLDAILAGDNRVERGNRLIDNELFVDFE